MVTGTYETYLMRPVALYNCDRYGHIVLLLFANGMYGSIGLSRRPDLYFKVQCFFGDMRPCKNKCGLFTVGSEVLDAR